MHQHFGLLGAFFSNSVSTKRMPSYISQATKQFGLNKTISHQKYFQTSTENIFQLNKRICICYIVLNVMCIV